MQALVPTQTPLFDVAVIGGGFSGTAAAVQIARLSRRPRRIAIFDRDAAFGRGTAYSALPDYCVLNVRAGAMGAFPDAESDFAQWLRRSGAFTDDEIDGRFVARRLYGDYLRSLLDRSAEKGRPIERWPAEVVGLARDETGFELLLAGGKRIAARAVVLAIGNLQRGGFDEPAITVAMTRHAVDPHDFIARGSLDSSAGVLIVGTGLTALDVLAHLAARAHRGPIVMLSRHGRFPLPHAEPPGAAAAVPMAVAGGPREVVRTVRRMIGEAAHDGHSWQSVIDGLRPHIDSVWQNWSVAQRQQFCRHVAPIWHVHRHRAPPSTLAVRERLLASGQLRMLRGRLRAVVPSGSCFDVAYTGADGSHPATLRCDRIFDCSGPPRDIAAAGDPLVDSLFAAGLAQREALGAGLAARADGSLIGARGGSPIYVLGPPLRGTLAETSAVREIRVQARAVAEAVVAFVERRGGELGVSAAAGR